LPEREGQERFRGIVTAYQESKTVMVAVRLGVFTALNRGAKSAAALAAEAGGSARNVELLLNALTGMELLEKKDGLFSNTPEAARFLAEDGPDSMGPLFRHQDNMWEKWSRLEEAIRGRRREPSEKEDYQDFIGAMAVNGRRRACDIVASVDLSGRRRLLDLGGGPGSYAAAFAHRAPDLEITLFDYPETLPLARRALEDEGLVGRIRLRGGDLFSDDFGDGFDLIWASHLIHTYRKEEIEKIVRRCRRALSPGGQLALHDFFLDRDRTRPRRGAVFALHMLVVTDGGRTYSYQEIEEVLAECGFTGVSHAQASEQSGLVTGIKC
jgi:SAM-dependent methyltransferase